jgi:Na+/phosphate symporter
MTPLNKESKEFIARIIADLGKAVLTVGFASYFFEKLPTWLRISFVILGVGLLVLSVIIYARKGEN